MKGLVINHNDIDDSHTCSYAFTESKTGEVSDFGIVSRFEDNIQCKDPGAEVLRRALRTMIEKSSSEFRIYNHSDYTPQLEISRFPYDVRERAYEENNYEILEDSSGTFSHTGGFLVNSALRFVSLNYSRFEQPVSTEKPPGSKSTSDSEYKYQTDRESTYYMYTDASYHPEKNETGISLVIIGENGGMYALGQKVESQIIVRAELLAFLKGLNTVQNISNNSEVIAHTDCQDIVRSINDNLKIDPNLDQKAQQLINKDGCDVDLSCIGRESNSLADSMAKVGRSRGKITIGSLNTL